ncbi:SDR family oxidoreductase [Streptomyces sp. BH105]|uniref:SDR family oxidoreductase n=1 Tax=Streptomyces sp. BH105 TaxID=3410408 RepID=UPI003CFACD87
MPVTRGTTAGTAGDIANAVVFLASDLSTYISGAVIPVDEAISDYTLSTSDADTAAANAFNNQQVRPSDEREGTSWPVSTAARSCSAPQQGWPPR